ncbi:uncharacterized protein [Drosophila bipectinata]|uniref:uncharacterized protein n=1 Tax=Drosophila bipectinata TaxID=42026 RepID=UPI001C8A0B95|nr:uncharacterized protein LOC108127417 [Drosophila bipectinata]
MQKVSNENLQFSSNAQSSMKIFLLIVSFCIFGLVLGDVVTKPTFIRSRYSLRWGKTTTVTPEPTAAPAMELPRTTADPLPKLATSTASADYDYYGNVESENMVHK